MLNRQWQRLPLQNFRFFYKGVELWYSRATSITHIVFCRNQKNQWCVLANKRGPGSHRSVGLWNLPCAYIKFDETGEMAAQFETYEETNVYVKKNAIRLVGVDTDPDNNCKQCINIQYMTVIEDKTCEEYELSNKNSKNNEVQNIAWIPLDDCQNYNWAFSHQNLINIYKNKITYESRVND